MSETSEKYINLFRDHRKEIGADDPSFLEGMRTEAMEAFSATGFPFRRQETYKYTFLEPVFDGQLAHRFAPRPIHFDNGEIFRCDVPMLDSRVLTVLNGYYHEPEGEKLTRLSNGILFGSLKEAIREVPGLVSAHLGKYAPLKDEAFVALNGAFSRDGVFLYVPKNQQLEKPIQIINLLLSDSNEMVQHRNLIVLEENASAEVIICDHTLSPHMFLTNSVTEARVGSNASLDLLRLQNEHNNSCQVTNTWIHQEKDSRCQHSTIILHGGMVRNNLHVKLAGPGAESHALGLFLIDKNQHVDNFTVIDHLEPNCTSNQHYKGVLDDTSTGAFSGKIHVHPDAQKTAAYQSNNNILLTDTAKMHTKPQLEIYADDVKCSHGATVGQLDEEAMFYLQSRGIPMAESRLMLMHAFAGEVISRIKQPALQERITDLVSKRLRGELSRCNNCAMHCQE
ncbi:MAG: Fe-S cluster assembly protein SufD [Bacteroidales bacterium]